MPDSWENLQGCLMANTADGHIDFYSDNLTSLEEYLFSDQMDPCNQDTDGDGMVDDWEVSFIYCGVDPLAGDSLLDPDTDTLTNIEEQAEGTNPCNPDTDGDGMPDAWEASNNSCLDPVSGDSLGNPDGDGADNLREFMQSTDPCVFDDTDGDGMPDSWEDTYACVMANTVDASADPDGDGLGDGAEVNTYATNPLLADTDGDSLNDFAEVNYGPTQFSCMAGDSCASVANCTRQVYGGHNYLFCDSGLSWSSAQDHCRSFGGDLAAVGDSVENGWIQTTQGANS